MDDLFGMLYSDLPPSRKLLTAITCNMLDSLNKLVQDGVDVNAVLMQQNGNTALHVSCDKGYHDCIKLLLEAGANPDKENNFGMVPIHTAMRNGHIESVRLLINRGSSSSDPSLVWMSETMGGSPIWLSYSAELCKLLLRATADFRILSESKTTQFYDKYLSSIVDKELVKLFFLTGNKVRPALMKDLIARADEDMKNWLKQIQLVQPLQAYARNEIRKHLHPNVFVGLRELPLPHKVKDYLLFEDEL